MTKSKETMLTFGQGGRPLVAHGPSAEVRQLFYEHGVLSGQLRATKNKKDRTRLLERLRVVGEKIIAAENRK